MPDYEKFSDEEIVEEVRSKNPDLYSIIIERYQGRLLRYAASLVGEKENAADTVQESLIKAFINLKSFDREKKFSSWIYRIVHNETLNFIKKFKREISLPENFDLKSDENIEEDYDKKEIANLVSSCFNELPLIYSEPLSLFYIEDKSYEEISYILRLPMGTVATRISRAKILMRKICQKKKK